MAQITLNIPEEKIEDFLEHIKKLDFVELDGAYKESSHEEIRDSIRKAFQESKLIEEGKVKSKPA